MGLIRVDTQQAYERIREMIVTLTLAPGAAMNPQALADELDVGLTAVRAKNADRAAQIMHNHVHDFYDKVRQILTGNNR